MTPTSGTRGETAGVPRQVASGLGEIVREWVGRTAMLAALLLVVVAALQADASPGLRAAGVVTGLLVTGAVVVGWWRKAPGAVQWTVGVVGIGAAVALLAVVGRA